MSRYPAAGRVRARQADDSPLAPSDARPPMLAESPARPLGFSAAP